MSILIVTDHDRANWWSAKTRHCFCNKCQDNVKMYKYTNLIKLYQSVQELRAFWQARQMLGKASYRFAYEWLDNEMYKYAKFGVGSRVKSIFTNGPWPAGLILGKATLLCMLVDQTMLTCISIHNLIKDIPRGSSAMKFHSLTTDEWTHKVIMHTCGLCSFFFTVAVVRQMFKSISLVSTVWFLQSPFWQLSYVLWSCHFHG